LLVAAFSYLYRDVSQWCHLKWFVVVSTRLMVVFSPSLTWFQVEADLISLAVAFKARGAGGGIAMVCELRWLNVIGAGTFNVGSWLIEVVPNQIKHIRIVLGS